MKLKPIIESLLETDQYKVNMQQVVLHQFNKDRVVWTFKCRNEGVKFTPEMIAEIREQVDHFCSLRFKEDELEWLGGNLPWLSADYIDFLSDWRPHRRDIFVNEGNIQPYNGCGLAIEAHGTWLRTMMYEIPILAIVNEVYFAFRHGAGALDVDYQTSTMEKFADLAAGRYDVGAFSEFGMRRRYSRDMQDWLVKFIAAKKVPGFVGTSNLYLARKYGVKAVGTMAHEYIMAVGQGHHEHDAAYSNHFALKAWNREYGVQNGIALTDTLGTKVFLRDFDQNFATLFSGVRHDSGDPLAWGEDLIAHYEKLGIDPKTKTLLFSDSLDFERATTIKRHFDGRARVAFGIGTYLSSVPAKYGPLNIVMKLTSVNGSPVAKISDTPGKGMCRDAGYVDYLKRGLAWRLAHD